MWDPDVWQRHWDTIRQKIRERWSQFSDEELAEFHGDVEAIVGWLQSRTGETREALVAWLSELTAPEAQAAAGAVAGSEMGLPPEWGATLRAAGEWVRRRPVESLAVAFGAGLLTGVLVGTVLRPKR